MKEKFKSFFAAIGYLLIVLLIQVSISLIGGIALGIYYIVKGISDSSNGALVMEQNMNELVNVASKLTSVFLLISSIVTVLIFILIFKIRKRDYKSELQFNKTKKNNLIIAMVLGFSGWLINSGILNILQEVNLFKEQFQTMNDMLSPVMEGNLFIIILTVGIVAPFTEEFIFRGVIYKTLNKRISIKWSIIIQGILFGAFHMNLIQGTYAAFLGILFGYLTYKSKSIWPAIIMHITNNIIATLSGFVLDYVAMNIVGYLTFVVLGITGIMISILYIKNINREVNFDSYSIY